MNENTVTKTIGDLGISAYVLMNNFKLAGKRDRSFAFFVPNDRSDELTGLNLIIFSVNFTISIIV